MFSRVSYIHRGHTQTHLCVYTQVVKSGHRTHMCLCPWGMNGTLSIYRKLRYVAWFAHEQKYEIAKVELPPPPSLFMIVVVIFVVTCMGST